MFASQHGKGRTEWLNHFNNCDIFNRRLHDKSWPHKYGGKGVRMEERAVSDYIFTCILVNCHHVWLSLDVQRNQSFSQFCDMLALELMLEHCDVKANDSE